MPENWTFNDFSAGWIPSDDPIAGRKNGFLKFQNCELDQLGAVVLSQPARKSIVPGVALATNAHTLFSKFIAGNRKRYFALTSGNVIRDGTPIILGGSASRAAFGVAFRYTLICSGTQKKKDDGTTLTNLGIDEPTVAPTVALGGAGVINGTVTYIQINVSKNGSYVGKSPKGPVSASITATNNSITVTPQDPAIASTEANEAWIFRRGGTLEQYYLVATRTVSTGFGAFSDNFSDDDAFAQNVTLNEFSLAVNDITDDILEICGPINQRHIYFTAKNIYFSEINSPDSYDRRAVMQITSNESEQFLWAKQISENAIMVGTTLTVYKLVGNYVQMPDGFMDVYLRSSGTSTPPLHIDACVFEGSVIYNSAYGWVSMNEAGNTTSLINASVERLYRGQQIFNTNNVALYSGIPAFQYPAGTTNVRYPCAISRNKLWVSYPTIDHSNPTSSSAFGIRFDVYDFTKQAWRTTEFKPNVLFSEEDDNIMGFFPADKFIRDFDFWVNSGKLIDDTTKQTLDILTPILDFNLPRNRKDIYSIKLKVFTAGDSVTLSALVNNASTTVALGTFIANTTTELIIDTKSQFTDTTPIKNIQLAFTGSVADFYLSFISFEYDIRPTQLSSLRIGETNFGTSARKRVSMIPLVIDTLGNTVQVDCYVDGVLNTTHTYTNNRKQVVEFQFDPPAVGKDFEFLFDTTVCVLEDATFLPDTTACLDSLFTEPVDPEVITACLGVIGFGVDVCPTSELEFYADNFSAYITGNPLTLAPSSPWNLRQIGVDGHAEIFSVEVMGGVNGLQFDAAPIGFGGGTFGDVYVFQPNGMVEFSTCGLWVEAQIHNNIRNGSHGNSGPALGLSTSSGSFNWLAAQHGVVNGGDNNAAVRYTALGTTSTIFSLGVTSVGDIIRLEAIKISNPDLVIFRHIRMNSSRVVQVSNSTTFASPLFPGALMGMITYKFGSGSGSNHIAQWKNWRGGFL